MRSNASTWWFVCIARLPDTRTRGRAKKQAADQNAAASRPKRSSPTYLRGTRVRIALAGTRLYGCHHRSRQKRGASIMVWSTPTLVEICVGVEINGYLPAEF